MRIFLPAYISIALRAVAADRKIDAADAAETALNEWLISNGYLEPELGDEVDLLENSPDHTDNPPVADQRLPSQESYEYGYRTVGTR